MPLNILILSDGKLGDLVQCRGVANQLTSKENITEFTVMVSSIASLPLPSMPLPRTEKDRLKQHTRQVDVVIASGRRTLPYLLEAKRNTQKAPFTVYLKDPKFNQRQIDMIWAPSHDRLSGDNVISTPTSPHLLTELGLAEAKLSAHHRFEDLQAPFTGVLLGGNSKTVRWNETEIATFCEQISVLPENTTILITPSRRTPVTLINAVRAALINRAVWFWSGEGENPYLQILAASARLIITGDSHNMVSEALAVGVPVHVYRPKGLHAKLKRFLDAAEAESAIQDLAKGFQFKGCNPINATPEIADQIKTRLRSQT